MNLDDHLERCGAIADEAFSGCSFDSDVQFCFPLSPEMENELCICGTVFQGHELGEFSCLLLLEFDPFLFYFIDERYPGVIFIGL